MASYVQHVQTANVTAAILAIGTANPPNKMYQVDYPDYYFRVTNSEHMTDLKAKFKRMCEKSMIRKRHMHLNEDMLKENPQFKDNSAASLKSRQVLVANEVPKLGYEAATKAIIEWGQPKSKITHVVFGTNSCDGNLTGANYHIIKLLGLEPTVKHFIVRQGGCNAGCTVLRIAKDMAENNRGARVLVVCSEVTSVYFLHAPSKSHLVPQALFGDGAGAIIVGASPNEPATEQPIFHLISTGQTTLSGLDWAVQTHLSEYGMVAQISPDLPQLISKHIEKILLGSFNYLGINDWNSIFWVAHPGGPAILDEVEAELGLEASKLSTSRQVLSEYGNMLGASVMFIMDEMRKNSLKEGKVTTGEGFDWGVLFGFGPGITFETIVLRSVPLN